MAGVLKPVALAGLTAIAGFGSLGLANNPTLSGLGIACAIGLAAWFLTTRIPLKVDIIRDRSTLAREADDGRIENVFMLQIMNTEEEPHRYKVTVDGLPGVEITGNSEVDVQSASLQSFNTIVSVPPEAGKAGSNPIHFEIVAVDNPDIKVREKAAFLMPR